MLPAFQISARGATHRGLVRKSNQDALWLSVLENLFIVADGMGGHAGGEIASHMCVQAVRNHLRLELDSATPSLIREPDILHCIADAVNYASAQIYEQALEQPQLKGMGTTATVFKIMGHTGFLAHVGDSRLYVLRHNLIYQMSHDHSLVNEQLQAGVITEEEARYHQLRNVITRSVGYQESEFVDTISFDLEANDRIILCSDGLHGKVSNREIAGAVEQQGVAAIEVLIDLANERGGDDNITVMVVDVSERL